MSGPFDLKRWRNAAAAALTLGAVTLAPHMAQAVGRYSALSQSATPGDMSDGPDADAPPTPQKAAVIPYGANRLEDTDLEKFQASLLEQTMLAGVPKPVRFDLFPAEASMPFTNKLAGTVIGDSEKDPFLDRMKEDLNTAFPDEPTCNMLALDHEMKSYRIFVGAHETIHDVLYNLKKGGSDLNQETIRKILHAPDGDLDDYARNLGAQLAKLVPAGQSEPFEKLAQDMPQHEIARLMLGDNRFNKLVTLTYFAPQIAERLADAGATLYLLSNYADVAGTKAFLEDFRNFRKAHFTDIVHDTDSSIEAAIRDFDRNPVRGMTIVETAQRARRIVEFQPDLAGGPDRLVGKIKTEFDFINAFPEIEASGKMFGGPFDWLLGSPAKDMANDVVQARRRACLTGPSVANGPSSVQPN